MRRRLLLVCGSRGWTDSLAIRQRLARETSALVVHGGARGADRMAAEACAALSMHAAEMPALWDAFGKRAGYLRNLAMLDLAPDLVIAFTTGSRGTQHTIDEAQKRGIPVEIIFEPSVQAEGGTGRPGLYSEGDAEIASLLTLLRSRGLDMAALRIVAGDLRASRPASCPICHAALKAFEDEEDSGGS